MHAERVRDATQAQGVEPTLLQQLEPRADDLRSALLPVLRRRWPSQRLDNFTVLKNIVAEFNGVKVRR